MLDNFEQFALLKNIEKMYIFAIFASGVAYWLLVTGLVTNCKACTRTIRCMMKEYEKQK